MCEERVTEKSVLLAHFNRNWRALTTALAQLSATTMTTIADEQGWTVKDHLIHLYYWERSALYFLQGKPRHEGLGVPEAIYATGDEDRINDTLFQLHRELAVTDALAQLHAIQDEMLSALEPLRDEDLQKRYRHYLPSEPGEGDGPPAMQVIYGNTAHHFGEHLTWIRALVAQQE